MNLKLDPTRLKAIIIKETTHIKRDPPSLIIVFAMPVLMLLLFGYAVTLDVNNISLVVLDRDCSQDSRLLAENFVQTGYFTLKYQAASYEQVEKLLDTGQASAALVIPEGYARKLHRREKSEVQFIVDGSDPLIARTALNIAEVIAQVKTRELILYNLKKSGISMDTNTGIDMRARAWYNPGLESIVFNIPGLIGLVMQNITMMLTAFTLVRERERGTLEQLIVTPVKSLELMIGKLIPYIVIAFLDTSLVLAIGTFWFKVPVNGSILLLLSLSFLFLLFALGLGLLFSTVAKTQLQAMQMTIAFILPSVLLSGFIFPRESMPVPIQLLGNVIPLTYFLHILRGIMLKGVGIEYLLADVFPLGIFGLVVILAASYKFRKRLE